MKKSILICILISISLLIILSNVDSIFFQVTDQDFMLNSGRYPQKVTISRYVSAEAIFITKNADFTNYTSIGDGTSSSPYVLEGLNITSSLSSEYLIDIQNTDKFFQINGCILSGGERGISLTNVENGYILNNSISNTTHCGILLLSSHHNNVSENIISEAEGTGISLSSSDDNDILNNQITNCKSSSILLIGSENNFIFNNSVGYSHLSNIYLRSSSNKNVIINNSIYNSRAEGIFLSSSDHNIISNNSVIKNGNTGIFVYFKSENNSILTNNIVNNNLRGIHVSYYSNNNTLKHNTVAYSSFYGISISSTNNTVVTGNDIIGNVNVINAKAYGTSSQAYDDGSNNTFCNNYWNEWDAPDSNNDNIVDHLYPIDGVGVINNTDEFPMVTRNNPQMVIMAIPTIIYPNGGETLTGTVTLQWNSADPSSVFNVTYTLFYSISDETSWFLIEKGIKTINYDWETKTAVSSIENETLYLLKVKATSVNGIQTEDISDGRFKIDRSFIDSSGTSTTSYTSTTTLPATTTTPSTITDNLTNSSRTASESHETFTTDLKTETSTKISSSLGLYLVLTTILFLTSVKRKSK